MATAILRGSTAMAVKSTRKAGTSVSWVYCLARPREGFFRRAGGIDACPVEGAEVVALLHAGDRRVGIGGIAPAPAQAGKAGVEIGLEEKAMKRHAEDFGRCPRRGALLRRCENRVEDGGMPRCDRPARLVGDDGINP